MRPNQGQEPGEQKKSVFDRLGRQLDAGRAANRRSPAQYGDHPGMHPGMHEPLEFGGVRYMRGDGHPEIEWRYQQNDRRNMPFGRDRHLSQVGPPIPMQMPPPPHYDIDAMPPGRQPPPYYQHPPHFQPGPPGPPPQLMGGPETMPMGMHHQRRPSPKYDRHGNPIRGSMRVDQPPGVTSPRNFMGPPMPGPGLMIPPGAYDMMPMRPGMYQPNRWPENPEMGAQIHGGRVLPDDRFMEPPNRFQQQQQQMKPPMMMNPEMSGMPPNFEVPRYSKWRERRDVITNLDRQTAQSSSKTDSLKSSLQQTDNKGNISKKSKSAKSDEQSTASKQSDASQTAAEALKEKKTDPAKTYNKEDSSNKGDSSNNKSGTQDISDGEIVDDEDSSDDSDVAKDSFANSLESDHLASRQHNRHKLPYVRKPTDIQPTYEHGKRRRLHDRDEYSMDYETISDGELEDFMSEKKLTDDEKGDREIGKNSSEIELLNALGLDWANLIELTKQSRKDTQTSDSALRRFSLPNYLPTLGITRELAGPEIYDLLMKVVQ